MIPGPGIIPADGWWFIARSADGGHLMLICTYQIDQTISSNHMQYNAWGVRDIDGYGCFVFEKDPSSVGPGVFNWRRVYSLGNHSMFLGLNYPIIQPIIDHITGDDYRAMQLPFARGDCVYTSYHGFHESPYPEIRRHSLLPDNLQCVKGIKLPCDGWLLQTRHAAMWFMPTANMHNLIRTDM
jgi:hypothetical protein